MGCLTALARLGAAVLLFILACGLLAGCGLHPRQDSVKVNGYAHRVEKLVDLNVYLCDTESSQGRQTMTERKPTDAHLITSSFGGGWVVPLTEESKPVLESFFGGPASFQPPIGEDGWLIEPFEVELLKEHVDEAGITVRLLA